MANPNKLSRDELVTWTANLATFVADGGVTGFTAPQNTALSDALTDANAELAAAQTTWMTTKADASEAVHIAQDKRDALIGLIQNVKDAMKSVNSPGSEYVGGGFDMPIFDPQPVIPETPTELAAFGYSNGINKLSFVGNNRPGSVTYVIECKIGDTAPYVVVGTTQKQKFDHEGVTPGQFYQYRCRAQAARNVVSEWSNEAVVYGAP